MNNQQTGFFHDSYKVTDLSELQASINVMGLCLEFNLSSKQKSRCQSICHSQGNEVYK